MAVSDAEYQAWLADDRQVRAILVEAGYHDGTSSGTAYLSSHAFVSGPSDTPANTAYLDVLVGIPEVRSRIDRDQQLGKLEVANDGSLDDWLDRSWEGWPLRVYIGDPAWNRDDYRLILDGTNAGLSVPSVDRLSMTWRDRRRELEIPAQTTRTSSGDLVPLALGEVYNAEPVLIDGASLIYRFHEDGNASVTAARDNGVSVSYTDNGDGTVTLSASPAGRVTLDLSGATAGTAAAMIEYFATRAGIASADIGDLTALPTWGLGLYIQRDETIDRIMDDIVTSLGAVWRFDRLGKLQVARLELPGSPVATFDADDSEEGGLTVARSEPPYTAVPLEYYPNWTRQDPDALAGSVSASDRDAYSKAYRTVEGTNSLGSQWPAAERAESKKTLIMAEADAQTEADRRATLRSGRRWVYQLAAFSGPFQIGLMDSITIEHPDLGFESGQDALVVGVRERPTANRVELELWR